MKYGIVDGKRISAKPNFKGICPLCGIDLVPKCGSIKVWHWAHKNTYNCDLWYENESSWHRFWKNQFPEKCQEIIIEKNGKKHIADICNSNGLVIEFQKTHISELQIIEREKFYGNMIWIIGGFDINISLVCKKNYHTFRWYYPRSSFFNSTKPLFFDIGVDKLFEVKKMYRDVPCYGWGYIITKKDFLKRFRS